MEIILSFLAALFAMYTFPTGYLALTAILTIIAYCVTESHDAVLGTLVLMVFLRVITVTLEPSNTSIKYGAINGPTGGAVSGAVENFQPRDPVSIHQRVVANKQTGPKVNKIFGVLESPNILNSLQISGIAENEQGATTSTVPAAPGAYETIRTPAEGFMPDMSSQDAAPRAAAYLQNGPDNMAIDTALVKTGTKLQNTNADIVGVAVGPSAVGAAV